MGPGLVVKAAMQRRFSLMVFGWSQIGMDIQPLVVMITGKGELHGFSHTLLGATLIGLVCASSGQYLGELGIRLMGLKSFLPITWPVAFATSYIGTYSHVLIDSIMHLDVLPFAPLSTASPLHGIISIETLHTLCLVSASLGTIIYFVVAAVRREDI